MAIKLEGGISEGTFFAASLNRNQNSCKLCIQHHIYAMYLTNIFESIIFQIFRIFLSFDSSPFFLLFGGIGIKILFGKGSYQNPDQVCVNLKTLMTSFGQPKRPRETQRKRESYLTQYFPLVAL